MIGKESIANNCYGFTDIIKFNFRSHFLGSLMYVFDESKPGFELLIIDGQQRIATLSILLLALHNLLENNEFNLALNH